MSIGRQTVRIAVCTVIVMLTATAFPTAVAYSQIAPQVEARRGAVSGTIRDTRTGSALPGIEVEIFGPKVVSTATDSSGSYRVEKLPPGSYTIKASGVNYASQSLRITLEQGGSVKSDIALIPTGTISGHILDVNDQPIADQMVLLMTSEYGHGVLAYVFHGFATSDDAGAYQFSRVIPGRVYYIRVQRRETEIPSVSPVPRDPERRRPVYVATYYPNVTPLREAGALSLGPGEHRSGVDIHMVQSASYCIDGVVTASGKPSALSFRIGPVEPRYGVAAFMHQPAGETGPDGRFRICDLAPGEYRLTAYSLGGAPEPFYGAEAVSIVKEDVSRVELTSTPRVALAGTIVVGGERSPEQRPDSKITVSVLPLNGAYIKGLDESLQAVADPTGGFMFPALRADDYRVVVGGVPKGMYVKDLFYGGVSSLYSPIRIGAKSGAELKVVIGADGGQVSLHLKQESEDLRPGFVYIVPAWITAEAELSSSIVEGQTDQFGVYLSEALHPGKYYVIATPKKVHRNPEGIASLIRAYRNTETIEVLSGQTKQLERSFISID